MLFNRYVGIDLGTANTRIYVEGKGLLFDEASVLAVDTVSGEILSIGSEAKMMLGRTPRNIKIITPVKDGVIADFDYTQSMIKYFLGKALQATGVLARTIAIIGIPSGITAVEERAVREVALNAGAAMAYLVDESLAAACGAGVDLNKLAANVVVNIGAGHTEVAVINMGVISEVHSIRTAGDAMDRAIIDHVRKTYNTIIGERTAEEIKIQLGNAFLEDEYRFKTMEVKGRDALNGLPRPVTISAREINIALNECVSRIMDMIKGCLEKVPANLAADIIERGIILTGGAAKLHGLDKLISLETGMGCNLVDDPELAVVMGTTYFFGSANMLARLHKN